MANTTNFNWETPDDTDLVKDGALAIRTLGNSIDTSFVDLKGGTSGQILSKNSNTDLDFVWITNDVGDITAVTAGTGITGGGTSGAVTITNDMATKIDAKGDLIGGTGADTYDRLAVGTNGQVLTADSTASTGLKWSTPSTGKIAQVVVSNLLTTATTTSSSFVDTGLSVTITPSSASNTIIINATLPLGFGGTGAGGFLTLTDGSNNILLNPTSSGSRTKAFTRMEGGTVRQYDMQTAAIVFQHSPASTSAQTYKIRMSATSGGTTCINRMGTDSNSADYSQGIATIVAYEVSA